MLMIVVSQAKLGVVVEHGRPVNRKMLHINESERVFRYSTLRLCHFMQNLRDKTVPVMKL